MATLASMTVRLGIDTNSLAADAARAQRVVRNMGDHMRRDGDRSGNNTGRSFMSRMASAMGAGGSALTGALTLSLGNVSRAMSSSPVGASIGLAIAGAIVATILPFVAAALSGMIVSVAGLGVIGLGALVLKDQPKVKAAAVSLKNTITSTLREAAIPMIPAFVKSLGIIKKMFVDLKPVFASMFGAMSMSLPGLVKDITAAIKPIAEGIENALTGSQATFKGFGAMIRKIGEGLGAFFTIIGEQPKTTGQALSDLGSVIKGLIIAAARFLQVLTLTYGGVRTMVTGIVSFFSQLPGRLVSIAAAMVGGVVAWFVSLHARVSALVHTMVTNVITYFSNLYTRAVAYAVRTAANVVSAIAALPGRAASAISSLASRLGSIVRSAGSRMLSAARSGVSSVISAVRALPGRAASALGNIGHVLYSSGKALISGFISGIKSMVGAVAKAVSSAVSAAKRFFPHSPAKEGPFSGKGWTLYSGQSLIEGFADGMSMRMPALRKQLAGIGDGMPDVTTEVRGISQARPTQQQQPASVTHVTNVYPQQANFTTAQLDLLQRRQEATSRLGRAR